MNLPTRLTVAILSLLAAAAVADAQPAQDRRPPARQGGGQGGIIVVAGEGMVEVDPDYAVVRLGAEVQAQEAGEAQARVNEIMQRAIDAVRELGVAEDNIQTSELSLYPVYSQQPPRPDGQQPEPRIIGYRASNVISVELEDLTTIGPVIDAVIAAGANQLQGVDFQLRDDAAAKADALRQAVESAQRKARVLAEAAGVNIAGIMQIREEGTNVELPESRYRVYAAGLPDTSTPVQPGQLSIRAGVTMVYRIGDPRRDNPDRPSTRSER